MEHDFRPMKLTNVDPADAQVLVNSTEWVMEQKMDGTFGKAILRYGLDPIMTNNGTDPLKHTAATQHLPAIWDRLEELYKPLTRPGDLIVLDGEIMLETGEYRFWDMPHMTSFGGHVSPDHPWHVRSAALTELVEWWRPPAAVSRVTTFEKSAEKRAMLEACEAAGVEGVVFKRRDARYLPGSRSRDVLKHKFVKTADVIVTEVHRPDPLHGHFRFAVQDQNGDLAAIGSCSAIGKPHVEVGQIIEVAYLHRTEGGRLVQPRMMRVRNDRVFAGDDQFRTYTREQVRASSAA